MSNFMDNYVDVATRIRIFREHYPTGCLRPYNPAIPFVLMEIGGREFIVYTAAAYRTPDDLMPAIAVAAEPSIGKTSFTKDSEVMNAETSAWGRAIVACLAADTIKIASKDEVQNRQLDGAAYQSAQATIQPTNIVNIGRPTTASKAGGAASEAQVKYVQQLVKQIESDDAIIADLTGGTPLAQLSTAQARTLINNLQDIKKGNAQISYDEDGKASVIKGAEQ